MDYTSFGPLNPNKEKNEWDFIRHNLKTKKRISIELEIKTVIVIWNDGEKCELKKIDGKELTSSQLDELESWIEDSDNVFPDLEKKKQEDLQDFDNYLMDDFIVVLEKNIRKDSKNTDKILDMIYDFMDDLCWESKFDIIDNILEYVSNNFKIYPTDTIIAFLIKTYPVKSKIIQYSAFKDLSEKELRTRSDWTENLLSGL